MSCEIFDLSYETREYGTPQYETPENETTRENPKKPERHTPTRPAAKTTPKIKTVVECPRPPKSYVNHWKHRIATNMECGWQMYGEFVAIADFSDAWQTGFVDMRGLPTMFFGTVDEARDYVSTLHDLLRSTYATLGISLPSWRAWKTFVDKWPFLTTPPTAGKKRRVHVLKPL